MFKGFDYNEKEKQIYYKGEPFWYVALLNSPHGGVINKLMSEKVEITDVSKKKILLGLGL